MDLARVARVLRRRQRAFGLAPGRSRPSEHPPCCANVSGAGAGPGSRARACWRVQPGRRRTRRGSGGSPNPRSGPQGRTGRPSTCPACHLQDQAATGGCTPSPTVRRHGVGRSGPRNRQGRSGRKQRLRALARNASGAGAPGTGGTDFSSAARPVVRDGRLVPLIWRTRHPAAAAFQPTSLASRRAASSGAALCPMHVGRDCRFGFRSPTPASGGLRGHADLSRTYSFATRPGRSATTGSSLGERRRSRTGAGRSRRRSRGSGGGAWGSGTASGRGPSRGRPSTCGRGRFRSRVSRRRTRAAVRGVRSVRSAQARSPGRPSARASFRRARSATIRGAAGVGRIACR